jgi:hypothetical protein
LETDIDNGFLFFSDALDVDLALYNLTVRQSNVEQQNPVSRHREIDSRLAPSVLGLLAIGEGGRHACVRHVRFDGRPGILDWAAAAVG